MDDRCAQWASGQPKRGNAWLWRQLFVTEMAQRVALEDMQMMGGYGYSSQYDMERLVRATLVSTIYGGASEIQRGIIAKTLGL